MTLPSRKRSRFNGAYDIALSGLVLLIVDLNPLRTLHGLLELWVSKEGLNQDYSGFVRLVGDHPTHNGSNSFGSRLHTNTAVYFLRDFPFPFEVASF